MKYFKKFSVLETTGGVYSTRKVPRWQMGPSEWLEYLDTIQDDWEDPALKWATA